MSILALLAIAAIFTIGGGLSAVIWTDFVQTILMIIGAVWLMVTTFSAVGGYEELIDRYRSLRSPISTEHGIFHSIILSSIFVSFQCFPFQTQNEL